MTRFIHLKNAYLFPGRALRDEGRKITKRGKKNDTLSRDPPPEKGRQPGKKGVVLRKSITSEHHLFRGSQNTENPKGMSVFPHIGKGRQKKKGGALPQSFQPPVLFPFRKVRHSPSWEDQTDPGRKKLRVQRTGGVGTPGGGETLKKMGDSLERRILYENP